MKADRRGEVTWFRVTDACNAHCRMCGQHVPRATPDPEGRDARRRLDELLAEGIPAELLLTGGEPTLHPSLGALVRGATLAGVRRVVLATNGFALGDPRRLARLVKAGVGGVRIGLFGSDPGLDGLMRRPGAFELAAAGIDASLAAGLRVEVQTVICALTTADLADWASLITRRWPTAARAVLTPYRSDEHGAPAELHVSPREVEGELRRAVAILERAGIAAGPDPGYGYHLCAFARVRGLGALIRHGEPSGSAPLVHPPACSGCVLRSRCAGLEPTLAARYGDGLAIPWTDRRRAHWLPLFERTEACSRTDRVALRQFEGRRLGVREQVIRILHACNQRCAFCWIDFEAPAMSAAEALEAIATNLAAIDEPSRAVITFTGGEPTLHPDLPALIRGARELGAGRVHLQTNAVRCADPTLADALARAGLTEALVSLHAAEANASDGLTAAPGTFERTVAGISNLCAAGVEVVINHVLTHEQAPRFPDFVAMLADRFAHDRLVLTVAVAGRIDRGPLDERVLPTMSQIAPHVRAGLELAERRGLRVRDVAHPCGIPPCIVGPDLAVFDRATMRRIAADERDGCVKPQTCRRCVYDPHCHGLRREYAQDHGTDELRPILEPDPQRETPGAPVG